MSKNLSLALRAGEIMLKNGSETYRAQNIINLILKDKDIIDKNITIIGTAIIITVQYADQPPITMTKSIARRTNNLHKLSFVSKLALEYNQGKSDLLKLEKALEAIDISITYPVWIKVIATSLATALFTLGYGGTLAGALAIFFITILPAYLIQYFMRQNMPFFLSNILAGAVISFLSLITFQFYPEMQYDKMISSVIIILTPGVMAVTAIRDLVNGDFITGASRGIDAIILAAGLSIGVGAVLSLYLFISGGVIWKL